MRKKLCGEGEYPIRVVLLSVIYNYKIRFRVIKKMANADSFIERI